MNKSQNKNQGNWKHKNKGLKNINSKNKGLKNLRISVSYTILLTTYEILCQCK